VLDTLISHFLESRCIHPTFLTHHPECLSPLARSHPTLHGRTERFELFINGAEYANSYSELNDPIEQKKRMTAQAKAANEGDEEAQPLDQHFCSKQIEGGRVEEGGESV
jgi:lysyl-tRNA synthetase class 2